MDSLVSDTSFWVDLDDGDIPFIPFKLPFSWIITDFASRELIKKGQS